MKVVCAAKHCKYSADSEDSSQVVFINFPNDDTSKAWVHHCGRADLLMKSNEELHLNYCICSHHIADRYYISKTDPIIIQQHAVPTLFGPEACTEKDPSDIFNRTEHTGVPDSAGLTYCDMGTEIEQYQDIGIRFSNLCRLCGEPTADGIEIFSAKGIALKLRDKISLHTPISVNVEDLTPQKLCIDCYNKLEASHSLVTTCLRTDMRMRRFLNIEDEPHYDNRYNAIVEECSLEVAEEMCITEATHTTALDLPSDKIESNIKIPDSHEVAAEMIRLDSNDAGKSDFENPARNGIHSELSNLIDSYNEINKKNPCMGRSTEGISDRVTSENNEYPCLFCKDTFKTKEMFEDHKMLCDEEEVVLAEQSKEINFNMDNNSESTQTDAVRFRFIERPYDICEQNCDREKILDQYKRLYCKSKRQTQGPIDEQQTEGSIDEQQTQGTIDEQESTNENNYDLSVDLYNTVTTESTKKCGHCELTYSTKKELLNHIAECHGGQLLFKCFMCNKSYEKWSSLDIHEATHRMDKPYLCDLCGKSFKHSNNLRGHKRTHLDESKKKRHVCEICGTAFRSRFHLGEHMNQHDGKKPYSCDKCGKAFFKRIQLRQHKLSHESNKHVCPICGATFNRRGNMNTHVKRHNNGNGAYTCSVCTHRCKSMSDLKLHRKKHTEQDIIDSIRKKCVGKTIWQCDICSRVFSKRAVLLNHERTHGGERISVECDMCGKKLASKSSLMYHKKSVHSTERPHMCQYCGDSFVSKEARLIHERVHTGERPYACKICKMQYKCSSNLNQHMKIHLGVRPHKCGYCNKAFTRKGALNVHERTHTGVKPFPCSTCGRTFSQKNDMLKHTKTHDAKSMRCERCNEVFTRKKDILKHVALHEENNTGIQEYVEVQQQIEPYAISITCSQIE